MHLFLILGLIFFIILALPLIASLIAAIYEEFFL